MIEFDSILEELINEGITVTVFKRNGIVYFDLNLESKSWLHLSHDGEKWTAHMRYNVTRDIDCFDDVLDAALDGMHGKDYISNDWKTLLTKHGYTVAA